MADAIRQAAETVLQELRLWRLPVDPLRIAKEEGIELAPSLYGLKFDARIEYFHEFDRFGIYYQQPGIYRTPGRVNFSIAHELGHFYLPEHRQRLRAGERHNSSSDYSSKNPREKEADRFAANLLMPKELFIKDVEFNYNSLCTLKTLSKLADRLGTSLTSTALRYCDCSIEQTMVIVSKERIVQWSVASEDMKPLGTWYVENGTEIPVGSPTATLYDRLQAGGTDDFYEGSVSAETWFDWPKIDNLWEECKAFGNYVLTYLAVTD